MRKILLSLLCLSALSTSAQITIFEDSFDTYDNFLIAGVGSWTLTDVDLKTTYGFTGVTFLNSGVAKSFQVFNSTATTPPLTPSATSNWTARTGAKSMVCFAAANPAPSLNNDWLISPQVQLGATGNVVSFWAKSCDANFGVERFKVGISTTGTAPADFTIISPGAYVSTLANVTYVEYTYPLDTYAGQQVYIGINCVSNDQFGFSVDDFKVTATTLKTSDFFASNFKVFPNPTSDVINLMSTTTTIKNISVTDLNGRVVKNINANGVNETVVNIADLNAGMYFLNVDSELGSGTTKIIKK